jgi:hypothetical protein
MVSMIENGVYENRLFRWQQLRAGENTPVNCLLSGKRKSNCQF